MRVRMNVNGPAFQRLRTLVEAMRLDDGDRSEPLLRALDTEHCRQVKAAFATHGATVPTGPWPPWSERYAAWRRRHGLGQRMMRLTDTLFEKSTSPLHGNHIARWIGALRFEFGFTDDAGFFHQNGSAVFVHRTSGIGRVLSGPRGVFTVGFLGGHGLPKRSLIDKSQADHQGFVDTLVRYWRSRIQQALRHG